MTSSIEFGVLREGSTTTLASENRASTTEFVFEALSGVFEAVTEETGISFDTYGSATLAGSALGTLLRELKAINPALLDAETKEFVVEFIRVTEHAHREGKALSYFGL